MQLISGTQLGRYGISSQLGAGGMGEVYLASVAPMWWDRVSPSRETIALFTTTSLRLNPTSG